MSILARATITLSRVNDGATGAKGDTGTSVSKTYTQYYLSTSNTTQTGGSWSNTMPTWSSGKYIWQREITVLSTGSTVTGTAVLANGLNSANQTASTANSNASSAVSTANTAKTTADTASSNASKAVTTANSASTAASEAKTTATNAQSTANTAKTTADTAKSTADTAKSTANAAQTTANTAKTATDQLNTLIRETTEGVEVAKVNSAGAYTGMRTEQTTDAYLIKDKAGTTLASYGANTVELGKGNSASTISLSNGNTTISTYQETDSGITYTYGNISFPNGNGFVGGTNTNAKARVESMITPSGSYAQVGLVAAGKETTSSTAQTAQLTISANTGHPNVYLKATSIDIKGTSNTFSDTIDNTITALTNGLALSNCAFYHQFGVNQTAITGGWNNFTTTNINVPAASLGVGTYLVILSICLTGQATGYCQALWWLNGAEAISYGFQQRNNCYVANGKDSYFNLMFLWKSDGKTAFSGYPRLESNVKVKPWRASVALIKLNNGSFTSE